MTKQKLPISPAQVDESATPPSDTSPDKLIPDPAVCAEFGVTAMTLWRWTRERFSSGGVPIKVSRLASSILVRK